MGKIGDKSIKKSEVQGKPGQVISLLFVVLIFQIKSNATYLSVKDRSNSNKTCSVGEIVKTVSF